MNLNYKPLDEMIFNRRDFLKAMGAAGLGMACGPVLLAGCSQREAKAETFIGKVNSYQADIAGVIRSGFRELGIQGSEIRGKRILLKPNLVELPGGSVHVVTHPAVVRAAAEMFWGLGAAQVIVGDGPGHCRDTYMILEDSGFDYILKDKKILFSDLNYDEWCMVPNMGKSTKMQSFILPKTLQQVDWIVSMPKLKTHHWAGVTLSMKNLFGTLPGMFYGWPKNVLHIAGINESILDINSTIRPHFAIVDGIIGMEGDGPIMGVPKHAGLIVMGRNLLAVDATCARVMGIDPYKVKHLCDADGKMGKIQESMILQRGENWRKVKTNFQLIDSIPAHRGLRMS